MKHPAGSFKDLDFLVADDMALDSGSSGQRPQPKKFVIFFDSKNEAASAGRHLRRLLPIDQRHQVIWYMADMSTSFKEKAIADLASGKIRGILTTDVYGMVSICTLHHVRHLMYLQGMDLSDIDFVGQYKNTCDPCMLWQRFGRAGRDKDVQATALLFVESKDLDPVDPLEGRKRKSPEKDDTTEPKSKRARKEKPVPRVLDMDTVGEDEFWKARKEVYHEPIGDGKKAELSQVLDDIINAEGRGIHCRRKPFKVYFDDEEHSGLCASLLCSTLTNVPQESAAVVMPLMGIVLVVHHGHLVSHWGRGHLEMDQNISGTLKGEAQFTWHIPIRNISCPF